MRLISYQQFIEGIPFPSVPTAPEQDPVVLRRYLELCKQHGASYVMDRPIYQVGSHGLAITPDWWDDCLEIPIYHQTCHPFLPWTFEMIVEAIPDIMEVVKHLDIPFAPESFIPYGEQPFDTYVAKLCSRRCELGDTLDDTMASLNTKRRYKIKQALDEVKRTNLTTAGTHHIPRAMEVLRARFEDEVEYQYALIQVLWAVATVSDCIELPDTGALGFFIERDFGLQTGGVSRTERMFQAIIQDTHNSGAQILGQALKLFSGTTALLEPTCKTSFNELSIDTYKRLATNADNDGNMLFVGTAEQTEGMYPPFNVDGQWVTQGNQ